MTTPIRAIVDSESSARTLDELRAQVTVFTAIVRAMASKSVIDLGRFEECITLTASSSVQMADGALCKCVIRFGGR